MQFKKKTIGSLCRKRLQCPVGNKDVNDALLSFCGMLMLHV